jgi:predicted dehydrogenase
MAKKRTVNVALIGAGFTGKAHSNAYRKVGMFFDLPARPVMKILCDLNQEETKARAERYGWEEVETDWRRVVNREDIDVVDVCTPGNLHYPMMMAAIKAGKHVVCEKPLANSVKEAAEMCAAAEKARVKHMCGFNYRFAPAVKTIQKMVSGSELGEIYHFRAAYQQDWIVDPNFPLVWRLKKKLAGSGALGDIGAHITDMCHYLIGPISEVCASMRTFVKRRPIAETMTGICGKDEEHRAGKTGTVDVDDAAIFLAHIKGAVTLATFEATRFALGRRNYHAFEIYGSEGSVYWNFEDMNVFHYYNGADARHAQGFRRVHATDPAHPYAQAWWPTGHIIGYEHLFVHELADFLASIEVGPITYPTFRDGLACHKVLDAVERSAKTRQWVAVK